MISRTPSRNLTPVTHAMDMVHMSLVSLGKSFLFFLFLASLFKHILSTHVLLIVAFLSLSISTSDDARKVGAPHPLLVLLLISLSVSIVSLTAMGLDPTRTSCLYVFISGKSVCSISIYFYQEI